MFPKTSVLCLATKDSDILRFILAVTKVYLAYQFRAPNSQPFEVVYYAESSIYLKSFATANGQLFNLHKFVLFSRIKAKNGSFAKKGPYKGRNQRIYCVPFWFGPKFKTRGISIRKCQSQVCYLLGHVLKINLGTSLFTFANKFFKLLW